MIVYKDILNHPQYTHTKTLTKPKNPTKEPMNYLVFDTETTGLPRTAGFARYYSAKKETHKYDSSRVIQLAWSMHNNTTHEKIKDNSFYIYDSSYVISPESTAIHGITQEKCKSDGKPFGEVMKLFIDDVKTCDLIIAHNIPFDFNVILAELYRRGMNDEIMTFASVKKTCTMKMRKRRPRKLTLMYKEYFEEDFDNAHDALADVNATARCFAHMRDKLSIKVINL